VLWFLTLLLAVALVANPAKAQKVYEPKDKDEVEEEKEAEAKWLWMGESKLKPGKKQVKILVGWERGRIDSFKVRVEDRTVEITEVEVHYGKGAKDLYELEELIQAGKETGLFTFERSKKSYLRKLYIRFRFPEEQMDERTGDSWKQPARVEIVGRRKVS
jgi:hypothetical protein